MKTEELRKQLDVILDDMKIFAPKGNEETIDKILALLSSQRPKDESIEERAIKWADWACGNCSHTHVKFKAAKLGYIKGCADQDALRSEEVEDLKNVIESNTKGFKAHMKSMEIDYELIVGRLNDANKQMNTLESRLSSLTVISNKMEEALTYVLDVLANPKDPDFDPQREALAEYQSFKTTKQ